MFYDHSLSVTLAYSPWADIVETGNVKNFFFFFFLKQKKNTVIKS